MGPHQELSKANRVQQQNKEKQKKTAHGSYNDSSIVPSTQVHNKYKNVCASANC